MIDFYFYRYFRKWNNQTKAVHIYSFINSKRFAPCPKLIETSDIDSLTDSLCSSLYSIYFWVAYAFLQVPAKDQPVFLVGVIQCRIAWYNPIFNWEINGLVIHKPDFPVLSIYPVKYSHKYVTVLYILMIYYTLNWIEKHIHKNCKIG